MPRRLTGVKDHLKSWPLIGRANFISTNGLSFALGSQPLCFGKTVNLNSDERALISNLGEEGTPMFDPRLLLCLKK